MKHRLYRGFILIFSLIVILAGCSTADAPKKALEKAMANAAAMSSYAFEGKLELKELSLPPSALMGQDPAMLAMLSNATLGMKGVYQADPMQLEMTMDLGLQGDLAMNIKLDLIMQNEKMWIKLPQTPLLPLGELGGQYIELDLNALAEEQGVGVPNPAQAKQMQEELMAVVFKHLDDKTYFKEVKKADVAGLPADLTVDQTIQLSVTQDTLETLVLTTIDKIVPELIELLLANESYQQLLQLSPDDLNKAKEALSGEDRAKLSDELRKMKDVLQVETLSATTAIHKGLPVYQAVDLKLTVTEQGETSTIGAGFSMSYRQINEPVTFQSEIPQNAITIDQLLSIFMGGAF